MQRMQERWEKESHKREATNGLQDNVGMLKDAYMHHTPEMFGEYICYMKFRWEFHEMHSQRAEDTLAYPITLPDSLRTTPSAPHSHIWERIAERGGWDLMGFWGDELQGQSNAIFMHNSHPWHCFPS
ncbi:hypothetical protein DMENIID0001_087070 [Sergentomyia squamirostris]